MRIAVSSASISQLMNQKDCRRMENMTSFRFFLVTILCVLLSLTPLDVECTRNKFQPTFNRGQPPQQQQQQQQQPGPNRGQPPQQPQAQWPPRQPQQQVHVAAKIPRPWDRGLQPPQQPPAQAPFRPEPPAPPPFQLPQGNFPSLNEIPVDEVVKPAEVKKTEEKILDAVDKLSEEIVEAVVERLEEDEALAIELEREGFDPNARSTAVRLTVSASPLLVLTLTICAYIVKNR